MSTSTPITQYVLVRRTGLSPDAFAERTGLHPDLARKLVASRTARRPPLRRRRDVVRPIRSDPRRTHPTTADGSGSQLLGNRARARSAGSNRKTRNSGPQKEDILMDTGSLTEKSREALQEAQNVADQNGPHRSRRRAPAARIGRSAGWVGAPTARTGRRELSKHFDPIWIVNCRVGRRSAAPARPPVR